MKPRHRSHSLRRVKLKTPSGENKMHFVARKPKIAHCSKCKDKLHGVPRDLPNKIKNMAKTEKRPERVFGGKLCASCTKQEIKERVRSITL
ncbi:MAG: 50S ribosomal protein L34e [DPANN group archaeon]|nr:50S ribosomal protein L34e [DPANN group archaeon]